MSNVFTFAGKGTSSPGLNSVEEILDELRAGRMVVIMDDEDRENEGDLLMPASLVRPEDINFMARFGRGLICLTLTRERCRQLLLAFRHRHQCFIGDQNVEIRDRLQRLLDFFRFGIGRFKRLPQLRVVIIIAILGETGRHFLGQRNRLRDAARCGECDAVVIVSPDRLARNYAHPWLLIEECEKLHTPLIFLQHPFGDSPQGKLLTQMQGMIAEYERAQIAERTRRGRLAKG